MRKFSTLCCILLFSTLAFGQQKYEKESRIKKQAVPQEAVNYMDDLFSGDIKVRWYSEENLDGHFYEGKAKSEAGIYSVKFTSEGELQDIELTRDFDQLPGEVQGAIEGFLSEQYDRYRIKKVQVQWIGEAEILQSLIRDEHTSERYTTNYEIVFSAKKNKKTKTYEALFDVQGQQVKTKEIITRNLSHLLY